MAWRSDPYFLGLRQQYPYIDYGLLEALDEAELDPRRIPNLLALQNNPNVQHALQIYHRFGGDSASVETVAEAVGLALVGMEPPMYGSPIGYQDEYSNRIRPYQLPDAE